MTWLCGVRFATLGLVTMFLVWTGFAVGYARGIRHEAKRLRKRLMLAGSRFANNDD